jgi:hypothetical protein
MLLRSWSRSLSCSSSWRLQRSSPGSSLRSLSHVTRFDTLEPRTKRSKGAGWKDQGGASSICSFGLGIIAPPIFSRASAHEIERPHFQLCCVVSVFVLSEVN